MLLSRAAAIHISSCTSEGLSADTIRLYTLIHRYYTAFLVERCQIAQPTVEDLNPLRVHEYLASLRARDLAPRTISHYCRVLKAWGSCLSRDLSTSKHPWPNPLAEIHNPRVPTRLRTSLEPADFQKLLHTCAYTELPNRNAALLLLMGETGLRVSELCGIQTDAVTLFPRSKLLDPDAAHGTVRVIAKGNVERELPFGRLAHDAIKRYLDPKTKERPDSPYRALLLARTGLPLSTDAVRFLLHTLQAKAGITQRVHPHLLRASYATWQARAGMDPYLLQQLMGHAELSQTLAYIEPERAIVDAYSSPLARSRVTDKAAAAAKPSAPPRSRRASRYMLPYRRSAAS